MRKAGETHGILLATLVLTFAVPGGPPPTATELLHHAASALPRDSELRVSFIEDTRRQAMLGQLRPGACVHVETDVHAKYVRRLIVSSTRVQA